MKIAGKAKNTKRSSVLMTLALCSPSLMQNYLKFRLSGVLLRLNMVVRAHFLVIAVINIGRPSTCNASGNDDITEPDVLIQINTAYNVKATHVELGIHFYVAGIRVIRNEYYRRAEIGLYKYDPFIKYLPCNRRHSPLCHSS